MSTAVGNIHVNLVVGTGQTRAFTSAANVIGRDSDRMRAALGGTNRSVASLRATMSQGVRSRIFSDMIRQASQANNEVTKLRSTMMALAAITGTSVTGAFAATYLLQTADAANRLNNQLRTVTNSEENLLAVRQRLYDVSQLTRSDMQATVTLYARISRAAQEFGKSQEDIVRVAETVQKAFAIGGATQQEAWGGAIQLSQGIASDRFSGEEYRSVAENAPVLLQNMARHLGVTIGKLREMAHAGELTGRVVTDAILGASEAIDESFNRTIVTAGQSMTRVGNAFLMYIGETDASVGVTRRLSEALSNLAENFDSIAPWLTGAVFTGATLFGGRMAGRAVGGAVADLAANTRAARENALALATGNAVALNSARANLERTRAVRDATQADLAAIAARVRDAEATAASLRNTLALTQAQRAKTSATLELNRGIMEATGRTGLYNTALSAQNAATRTALATQRALSATEKALVADKALLASQTAAATAATTAHNAALAANTVQARAAATALSGLRTAGVLAQRIGGGMLGLFGGWTGLAFTAAIAGMALYASNAAKAQERTVRLTRELHSLGLISDDVAGVVDGTASSIESLGASALRNKLRDVADELERIRGGQNVLDQILGYDPVLIGNMIQQMDRVRSGYTHDGWGINTLSPEQLDVVARLREIAVAARDGTDSVEGLQERLTALSDANPDMPRWLDTIVENLQRAIPYMDGLKTRAEQLQATLNASRQDAPAWLQNLIAQDEALAAVQAGADIVRQLGEEQIRVLQLTAEEARLEKIIADLRKDAVDALEDGQVIQEAVLEGMAREILEAEKAKKLEEERAAASEKRAEALKDYLGTISEIEREVSGFTDGWNEGDRAAARMIQTLMAGFRNGSVSADRLHAELADIGKTNISGGMQELINKIQSAIPLAARLVNFLGRLTGTSVGELDAGRLFEDFAAGEIATSRMTSDQQRRQSLISQYMSTDLGGGIFPTREQATELAASIMANERAVSSLADSQSDAAKAAEQYRKGMEDLNRELTAAPLDPFLREVLAAAEGMGIATSELDAYIAAVSSGGLDAAPEKFRAIADAMREIRAIDVLQGLQLEADLMGMSAWDREIAETLRQNGIAADSIYGKLIDAQIRWNHAIQQGGELARDVFGGIAKDLMDGVSFTDALNNAVGRLRDRLLDMGMQLMTDAAFGFISQMLRSSFGMGGGLAGSPGGFLPGMSSPRLFSRGGAVTGPGSSTSDSILARLSDGEYVINAEATRKNRSLLDLINSGANIFRGFASGGFVGRTAAIASSIPGGALGGSLEVRLINESGQPMKSESATRKNEGGLDVVEIVMKAWGDGVAQGRADNLMSGLYGLRRRGV